MRALPWIVCLAAACDAGAKPEPAKAPAEAKHANPIPERRQEAASGIQLAYLPADSDVIAHVDVAKLRKSKLWATYANDTRKILAPGFTGCEYDPLGQATTVDIGIPITSQLTTFVVRGIDREHSLACFRSLTGTGSVKATFDGDYVTLTSTNALRVLTFVDDHTLVMQGSKTPTKQTLQSAIAAGTPLARNDALVALLARARTPAAITVASRPGSELLTKQMSQAGAKASFFYGSLDLTDQLALHYAMDLQSADAAKQMESLMKAQLETPQVKQLFDRVEARAQDKTVTVEVVLGETKLATLAGMFRGMLSADS